jgi:hypothetical protein
MTCLKAKNRPSGRFFKAVFGRDVLTVSGLSPKGHSWLPGMAEPVRLPSLDRGCTSKHWRNKKDLSFDRPFLFYLAVRETA